MTQTLSTTSDTPAEAASAAAQTDTAAAAHAAQAKAEAKAEARAGRAQDRRILLLAFLLPVLMMLAIFIGKGIFPFGDNSFLRTDMYHQYAPFFSDFWTKLHEGGSLFYTWTVGLGTNYTALFGYYLSSPTNWLLFLLPQSVIIEFMTYLIVIKIGLCSATFAWYLKKHRGTRTLIGDALFGAMYAMSGYFAAYSWNLMWLDCLLLAPLILFGLEQLIDEGRGLLYCVTLALCILSNYYISIMVCLFLVFYFIAYLMMKPRFGKDGTGIAAPYLRFVIYSLLAGGIAAVLLVPEAMALGNTASAGMNFPKTLTTYFSSFDMMIRHLTLVEVETGLDHWPNLYSGVVVIPLFVLYLLDEKIPYREKAVKMGLLLFFFMSFSMNMLNFIWHGFHYPNSLPCRQSFLYTLVLLTMCREAFHDLSELSLKKIAAAVGAALIFVLLAEKLADEGQNIPHWTYYANAAYLGLFGLIGYLYRRRRELRSKMIVCFVALLTLELTLNMAVTSVTLVDRNAYLHNGAEVQTVLQQARQAGDLFYRVEREDGMSSPLARRVKDDGAWYGYRSASIFSSTTHAGVTSLYKKVGMEGNTNAYAVMGSTPVTRAMLSIRYLLTNREEAMSGYETDFAQSGEVRLYRQNETLPLGYVVPADLDAAWTDRTSKVQVQNDFVSLTDPDGEGDVFYEIDSYSGSSVSVTFPADGYYVAELSGKSASTVTVTGGTRKITLNNIDRGYLIDLGRRRELASVMISSGETDKSLSLTLYRLDDERFRHWSAHLQEEGLDVTSFADGAVTGTVTAGRDGLLLFSIPYDEGWTVTVDGAAAELQKFSGAFLSVPVTAGTHTVQLTYLPRGLKLGALISAICVLVLVLAAVIDALIRRRKRLRREARERRERNAAAAQAAAAMLAQQETPAAAEAVTDMPAQQETPAAAGADMQLADTSETKGDEA